MENEKQCEGTKMKHESIKTVAACATRCEGVSLMFSFGKTDVKDIYDCVALGCDCVCELNAISNGTCNTRISAGFHLYKYGTSKGANPKNDGKYDAYN